MPPETSTSGVLIFCAGNSFDGPPSTDRRLALALADMVPVLWVEPPTPLLAWLRSPNRRTLLGWGMDDPAANVRRLRMVGFPGVTRPLGRTLSAALYRHLVRRTVARTTEVLGLVLANPLHRFPVTTGVNVYYATDDWVSGAELMGLDVTYVSAVLQDNVRGCDVLAAVSDNLLESLRPFRAAGTAPRELALPNGCDPRGPGPEVSRPTDVPTGNFAVLVGQLNERLDLTVLAALAERGVPVVVIGPRTERSGTVRAEVDRLFEGPNFHYLGYRSPEELQPYLTWASVGLTPYADTSFNRSSFPLKTLDYLAAGLTVVTTDLPSARQLACDVVAVAADADDFARLAEAAVHQGRSPWSETKAVELADQHSWAARARTLTSVLEQSRS